MTDKTTTDATDTETTAAPAVASSLTDAEREKALYPEGITDAQKQRYKPYLAHADAASIVLHGS